MINIFSLSSLKHDGQWPNIDFHQSLDARANNINKDCLPTLRKHWCA
jgi:hypothetical protein